MAMKTKDRLSIARDKAGILMKTNDLLAESGNVLEKNGFSRWENRSQGRSQESK